MDLKSKVVDEVYNGLRSSFLAVGKGRRPNVPTINVITRRLLVQLYFLKEEGGRPWREVEDWILKLKPDLGHHVRGRVRPIVEYTYKWCHSEDCCLDVFLEECVDFLALSPYLSSIGINRQTFSDPENFDVTDIVVCNELIVELHKAKAIMKSSKNHFHLWVAKFVKCPVTSKLARHGDKIVTDYFNLKNNKSPMQDFLRKAFTFNLQSDLQIPAPQPILSPIVKKHCTDCLHLKEEVKSLKDLILLLQSEKHTLNSEIQSLKSNSEIMRVQHDADLCLAKDKVNVLKLKVKCAKDKSKSEVKCIKDTISKNEISLKYDISNLEKKLSKAKSKSKELTKQLTSSEEEIVALNNKIIINMNDFNVPVKGTENNVYSDEIRTTAIGLVCETGVSAANVSKVIEIVANNLFQYSFVEKLPCMQTVLNIVDEGYALSQFQIVESILKVDDVTLHSDGTSRDQKKIVGHQLSLSNGDTFYLGYAPVATENSNTLLDLALSVLSQISVTYAQFASVDNEGILRIILSKITSLMTDRASAMKSYGNLFFDHVKAELGQDVLIHFLHCNAHYLLGLVSAFEKAIANVENAYVADHGPLGRDNQSKFAKFSDTKESATFRILRMASGILGPNGDQKNGCRIEWTTFCEKSYFPSFKSNRFNCHFEAAAALIFHLSTMKLFFTSGVLHDNPNMKIESVAVDIQDNVLMSYVCCLALFYIKVTGPYWKLVNSSVKYSEFHTYAKMLRDAFQRWSEDPSDLFNETCTSVFDNTMNISSALSISIHEFIAVCDEQFMVDMLRSLCKEALILTERQLAEFMDGGYFCNLDPAVQNQLRHCPLTNLIGESSFGDFDFDISKRRNASLHNRSAVHCIKRNKTFHYLKHSNQLKAHKLLKSARKRSAQLRQANIELEKKMRNDKKQIFADNQDKKIAKELKSITQRGVYTAKVKIHGGPCRSSFEVDELILKLNSMGKSSRHICECLKNEIRFCKAVLGHKHLKLSGTFHDLVDRLKSVLV